MQAADQLTLDLAGLGLRTTDREHSCRRAVCSGKELAEAREVRAHPEGLLSPKSRG